MNAMMQAIADAERKTRAAESAKTSQTTISELIWLCLKEKGPMTSQQVEAELDFRGIPSYMSGLYKRGLVTRVPLPMKSPGGQGYTYTAVGMKYDRPAGKHTKPSGPRLKAVAPLVKPLPVKVPNPSSYAERVAAGYKSIAMSPEDLKVLAAAKEHLARTLGVYLSTRQVVTAVLAHYKTTVLK